MDKKTRTGKALKNTLVSLMCYVINLVVSFICRTVFSFQMGQEYLGVSGLFTNILTILSFAELGIGTAVVYRLYAPLASHDHETVRMLMKLYKKLYFIIAAIVLLCGLAVIPLLPHLVKAPDVKESVATLYILYLINTVATYFFSYKKAVLTADQKDYIVSLITQIVSVAMNVSQIIVLLITHNFILYLLTQIAFNIIANLCCSYYVDKKYSYLKEKTNQELPSEVKKGLRKDVKGLLLTKIASTTFDGTDNIFISSFVGIKYVGILSNYTLILSTINSVFNKIFGSITASIGNLAVEKDSRSTEEVLKKLYFINASFYSAICALLLVLTKEFVVRIWLDDTYSLNDYVVWLAIAEMYFRSLHFPLHTTQMALGLFSQYRIMYMIAALSNVVLDFILVKPLGIAGLIISTIICRMMIYATDIYVVYKFGFKKKLTSYVTNTAKWIMFLATVVIVSMFMCKYIGFFGMYGFLLKGVTIIVVYLAFYATIFSRTNEFKYLVSLFRQVVSRGTNG